MFLEQNDTIASMRLTEYSINLYKSVQLIELVERESAYLRILLGVSRRVQIFSCAGFRYEIFLSNSTNLRSNRFADTLVLVFKD